jgi:hypothetical protein
MNWEIVHLHSKKYKILNPSNWEELAYGIHHEVLTPNKNTEVVEAPVFLSEVNEFDDFMNSI